MDEFSTAIVTIKTTGGLMDQQTTTVGKMAQDEFAITTGTIFNRPFHSMGIAVVFFEILKLISLRIAIAHTHLVLSLKPYRFNYFSGLELMLNI